MKKRKFKETEIQTDFDDTENINRSEIILNYNVTASKKQNMGLF